MRRAPFLVPALLRFTGAAARQDGWGRLLRITAGGAELSTGSRLAKGEELWTLFELGGERQRLAARVLHVRSDDDGYALAELAWTDAVERRRLSRVIVDVLSRA